MRSWGVDPSLLCNQHLLGEHVEMHMFAGTLRKGISVAGYVNDGLIEVDKIITRHEDLAVEMTLRGMNHKSPMPDDLVLFSAGWINNFANLRELCRRCDKCRANIVNVGVDVLMKDEAIADEGIEALNAMLVEWC